MGGNLVLKLAGEWGNRPPLCAVAAVCPAIDLAAGSDALHEPCNRGYEWHFLRGLMRRFRTQGGAVSGHSTTPAEIGPVRSIRQFDQQDRRPLLRLSRRRRLLLPRRQRPRGRPHRRSHADSSARWTTPSSACCPRPAPSSSPTRISPLLRRATEATAPISRAIRRMRFTGPRPL